VRPVFRRSSALRLGPHDLFGVPHFIGGSTSTPQTARVNLLGVRTATAASDDETSGLIYAQGRSKGTAMSNRAGARIHRYSRPQKASFRAGSNVSAGAVSALPPFIFAIRVPTTDTTLKPRHGTVERVRNEAIIFNPFTPHGGGFT